MHAAARFAERPAVTMLGGAARDRATRMLSYRALLDRVNQAANTFRRLGLAPDESVALLLPTLPETLIALWGAECAGRACPINYMLSAEQIAAILQAARARILVILGPDAGLSIWQKLDDIRRLAPELTHVLVVAGDRDIPPETGTIAFDDALAASAPELAFARSLDRDDIASYFHTGGSTGAPKLVAHTHGNEVHASWFMGCYFGMDSGDALINGFPLFHVAGAICYGSGCVAAGAHIVIPSPLGMRDRGFVANYWRIVDAFGITLLNAGPTFLTTILDLPSSRPSRHVRGIISGGSTLPADLAEAAEARLGIPLRSVYGMTETCGVLTVEPLGAPRSRQSVGWPLPYSRIRLLDPRRESGATSVETPVEMGVVAARGPQITPGYSDARRNAELFTADGWLITGDLGSYDKDGRLLLRGRSKDVIIRGGHNIDPVGIEDALMRHPAVQLCAAVGQPDPYAGELPVAFVVLKPGVETGLDAILAAVRDDIPEPAAVPKRLYVLPALPTTATGKILRPALRRMAAERIIAEEVTRLMPDVPARISCIEEALQDLVVVEVAAAVPETTLAALRDEVASYRLRFDIRLS
ncbi:MAG TPA: AMP-binding protein [Hyphomicrobiales bacterium]|nr:AMP-binding protein [Hyphomicrobiales bacterium]